MKVYAVYQDHGQYDGGYEFMQAFVHEHHAQAARDQGLGNEIEELEVLDRAMNSKIRYTVRGAWKHGTPRKGIPLSGGIVWDTTWDEFTYWETYSGYDTLPDVKVMKSSIQGVQVTGLDKEAVSVRYSEESRRWRHNRAALMDLTGGST